MKYDVTYSCGHEGTVELFGPGKERDRKLAWIQGSALCPEYQKEHTRKVNAEMGLVVDIRLNTVGNFLAPSLKEEVAFVFWGDSFSHKEELKTLGATYTNDYPKDRLINDLLHLPPQQKCWVLFCSVAEYENTFAKVKELATVKNVPSKTDINFFLEAQKQQLRREEKIQAELSELGTIPAWPDELRAKWPSGGSWNSKFYGKNGSWRIFINNQEIKISDELKEQTEKVLAARSEWRKKKEEIEKRNR